MTLFDIDIENYYFFSLYLKGIERERRREGGREIGGGVRDMEK